MFIDFVLFFQSAKIYLEDGHITFESAHNKDINFRSNFGQIKLNGIQIQDLLKLITNYKNDQQQLMQNHHPQMIKLTQSITELKDQLKNYDNLVDDVKMLKDKIKLMLNDDKIKPENVQKSISGFNKMKKTVDKFKDLLEINECQSKPCKNSATCIDLFGDYFCQCTDGWVGKDCNEDIDECKLYTGTSLECQNGAQCINVPGSYHCICKNGYQGRHCTSLTKDTQHICYQSTNRELCGHGQCVPLVNNLIQNDSTFSFSCKCEPGWKKESTSPACTEDIDECKCFFHFVMNPF